MDILVIELLLFIVEVYMIQAEKINAEIWK